MQYNPESLVGKLVKFTDGESVSWVFSAIVVKANPPARQSAEDFVAVLVLFEIFGAEVRNKDFDVTPRLQFVIARQVIGLFAHFATPNELRSKSGS